MKSSENADGAKEHYQSILAKFETRFVHKYVSKVPHCLETYHLTNSTIIWSLLVVLSGYLASYNIHWLWLNSFCILGQYITDLFDGAVGRLRKTGLIRWGFYMDHFLDYIFLCAILIGYVFIVPTRFYLYLFFILAIFGAFIVDAYLHFAATDKFKITHLGIGPTEVRLGFIIVNTLLILVGKTYLSPFLPYVFILSVVGIIVAVYRTQKRIWELDMKEKKEKESKGE